MNFFFLYPIVMSIIWMIGGTYFYFRYERNSPELPQLKEFPMVTIIIPAHNEGDHIVETVEGALKSEYPNYEILVVDDGSTDNTLLYIEELAAKHERVRALVLKNNMGKAAALNNGLLMSKSDILVTIDADCILDSKALHWIVYHFIRFPRVGAVTGNPRVRNRTTLLAKIQNGEYSSIIGLIKRTQRLLGKVLTVSGVIAAFRRQAIIDSGMWDTDMVTEDINITWKLEKRFWAVHYELNAIGWILVPETPSGLWKQRVRWAQGGIEVLRRHKDIWLSWKQRRLWPIYIDYLLSILWAYGLLFFTALWIVNAYFGTAIPGWMMLNPIPQWIGSMIALVCLIQFVISMAIDSKYDSTLYQHYVWVIWYPAIYWLFNAFALIRALPKALFKRIGVAARWKSPDRGLHVVKSESEAAPTLSSATANSDSVIIDAHHLVSTPRKIVEGTLVASGLTILSLGLIFLTLVIWFFMGTYFYNHLLVPAYIGDMDATIEMLSNLFLFALFVFLVFFIWAKYNIKFYAHLDRRHNVGETSPNLLARMLNTTPQAVITAQNFKISIMEVTEKNMHIQVYEGSYSVPVQDNDDLTVPKKLSGGQQ